MSETVMARAPAPRAKYKVLVKNTKYCKSCGICIELCPKEALVLDPETRQVALENEEACNGCGLCEFLCPDFVLVVEENES